MDNNHRNISCFIIISIAFYSSLMMIVVGFDQRSKSTSGPVSTKMGDRVRVQFPVPDIYFGM